MDQIENSTQQEPGHKPSFLLSKVPALLTWSVIPVIFFFVGLSISHFARDIRIHFEPLNIGPITIGEIFDNLEEMLPNDVKQYIGSKPANEKIVLKVTDPHIAAAISANSNVRSRIQVLFLPQESKGIAQAQGGMSRVDENAPPSPRIYKMGETLPASFVDPNTTPTDVLTDKLNRITDQLHVSDLLMKRTAFWFDVYTKYDSSNYLVHHSDFPWIIFKVLNADHLFKARGNKWANYHKGKRYLDKEKAHVITLLKRLSKPQNYAKLTGDEKVLFDLMAEVPGPRPKVFRRAVAALRVQMGQKDFFQKGLIASSQYLNGMEEIFAKFDLPIELTRLPLVESSFNIQAVSKVGASGIWQFMPSTGKITKLRVGNNVDERNSPIKATEAAAKLMLENFRLLKSWPLAMTAYNHGPGGVKRAALAAKSKDLGQIIQRYQSERFGFASSNFYCEYLAALHAERYQAEIFGNLTKQAPLLSDQIRLKTSMRARTVAKLMGMTLEEMRLYNPDLKARAIEANLALPKGYNLHVPSGRKERLSSIKVGTSQKGALEISSAENDDIKGSRKTNFKTKKPSNKKKPIVITFDVPVSKEGATVADNTADDPSFIGPKIKKRAGPEYYEQNASEEQIGQVPNEPNTY